MCGNGSATMAAGSSRPRMLCAVIVRPSVAPARTGVVVLRYLSRRYPTAGDSRDADALRGRGLRRQLVAVASDLGTRQPHDSGIYPKRNPLQRLAVRTR